MPKTSVFTMKLESDLRAAFVAAAQESHRPASQVVRELMREFVQQQQDRHDHAAFLQRKVDAARLSIQHGHSRSNAAVEADFAKRRRRVADRK